MTPILLFLAVQPAADPASTTPPSKQPLSVYALVYVGKVPKDWTYKNYLYRQIRPFRPARGKRSAVEVALEEREVAGLKIVKEQKDAVAWLAETLQVDPLDQTTVFRVSLTGGSPAEQAVIVNAVVRAYASAVAERDRKEWTEVLDNANRRCADSHKLVEMREAKLILLNRSKAKDEEEAKRIASNRLLFARMLADEKESLEEIEAYIRMLQEKLAKRPILILEWAEKPDSK